MWLWFTDYWVYWMLGLILLPGIIFSVWAQYKVSSTYSKYARIYGEKGITSNDTVARILEVNGCYDVSVAKIRGHLTDNFNPKTKVISLSESVYGNSSLAAVGVAAHEAGHALQYNGNYLPIKVRSALVPVLNLASGLMWPLILVGCLLTFLFGYGAIGDILMYAGVGIFTLAILFQLVTLPVEFNASKRAYQCLVSTHALSKDEAKQAKKVLNAAALTYVAALLVAILSLVRFLAYILIRRRSN